MSHSSNTTESASDYREYAPSPSLADHLLCFWSQSIIGDRGEYAQRVLPDGCIDIVFLNDQATGRPLGLPVLKVCANCLSLKVHAARSAAILCPVEV
jgi:hypothetical protein